MPLKYVYSMYTESTKISELQKIKIKKLDILN